MYSTCHITDFSGWKACFIRHHEEKTNYCKDVAGWEEWHGLIEKYPEDDAIHALYATRLGLCSMVEMGNISLERAITIFDNMKESVIDQRKKEAETKEKNQKQGT